MVMKFFPPWEMCRQVIPDIFLLIFSFPFFSQELHHCHIFMNLKWMKNCWDILCNKVLQRASSSKLQSWPDTKISQKNSHVPDFLPFWYIYSWFFRGNFFAPKALSTVNLTMTQNKLIESIHMFTRIDHFLYSSGRSGTNSSGSMMRE